MRGVDTRQVKHQTERDRETERDWDSERGA